MPQLDISTFVPQLVWLALTFLLLYGLMAKVALPRVGHALERRRKQIEDDLAAARRLKAESETVLAAYEKSLAEARAEAQGTIRETMERLAEAAAIRQREASAKLAAETEAAEARIATARNTAMANVRSVAIDVAHSAVSRLLDKDIDEGHTAAAVDAALKERA
jgi:F-type H+-transporting ATPase subunit b